MDLKAKYEIIVDKYLDKFCKKQGFDKKHGYWVGDRVGDIFDINSYFFSFDDIRLDVDNNVPKGKIIEWYDDNDYFNKKVINYESYLKGLRVKIK